MEKDYWGRIGCNGGPEEGPVMAKSNEFIMKEANYISTVNNRIYFYSHINTDRILSLNREVRDMSVGLHNEALIKQNTPANIFLHINSYGGSIFAGLSGMDSIINSIVPVVTIVDGCCASAATFLSVVGKTRLINKHSFMLVHQLSSVMWGKYNEFKDEMENLGKLMKVIKDIYKEYTKLPESKLDEILSHDLWFDAKQCLDYGMVDEII